MAVGTVAVVQREVGFVRTLTATIVASSSDGTIPDTALPGFEGRLLALETIPGLTQPTSLYDITIVDALGLDVLQGVGANRSSSVAEKVPVIYSGTALYPPVSSADVLTLKIANNSVHSAQITVVLYYAPGA
jgi:hypothetical protein